jgi:hypothetical protein
VQLSAAIHKRAHSDSFTEALNECILYIYIATNYSTALQALLCYHILTCTSIYFVVLHSMYVHRSMYVYIPVAHCRTDYLRDFCRLLPPALRCLLCLCCCCCFATTSATCCTRALSCCTAILAACAASFLCARSR